MRHGTSRDADAGHEGCPFGCGRMGSRYLFGPRSREGLSGATYFGELCLLGKGLKPA